MTSAAQMVRRRPVFLYGSLLDTRVLHALLRRTVRTRPAKLSGWQRTSLRSEVFPGLRHKPGAMTCGALIEVSRRELARLDAYEDDYYRRLPVSNLSVAGAVVPAEVYCLRARFLSLRSPLPRWELMAFRRHHGFRSTVVAGRFSRWRQRAQPEG